jgi:hypothetical protein
MSSFSYRTGEFIFIDDGTEAMNERTVIGVGDTGAGFNTNLTNKDAVDQDHFFYKAAYIQRLACKKQSKKILPECYSPYLCTPVNAKGAN